MRLVRTHELVEVGGSARPSLNLGGRQVPSRILFNSSLLHAYSLVESVFTEHLLYARLSARCRRSYSVQNGPNPALMMLST